MYSVRQFAALIGRSRRAVLRYIHAGRIPASQYVDGVYVIDREATVLRRDLPDDPVIRGLAPEFISEEFVREPHRVPPPTVYKGNIKPNRPYNLVDTPGFHRLTEGMTKADIVCATGIDARTVDRLREHRPVKPSVVWKLARGLEVDVHELLKG